MNQTLKIDQALNHATGFYKNAHHLMELCDSKTAGKELTPVAAVNLCFGCEILLKVIIYQNSGIAPLGGHNLGLVFETHLTTDLQDRLAKLFKELNAQNKAQSHLSEAVKIPVDAFRATNGATAKQEPDPANDDLTSFLKYQGITFLGYRRGMFDWRGHIEHPREEPFYFNFQAMDAFYQALDRVYNTESV